MKQHHQPTDSSAYERGAAPGHSVMLRTVRAFWVVAGMLCLAWSATSEAPDAFIAVGWALIALTFPAGGLVFVLFGFLAVGSRGWVADPLPGRWGMVVLGLVMLAAGYWQWFVLIPRIWKRLRSTPSFRGSSWWRRNRRQ